MKTKFTATPLNALAWTILILLGGIPGAAIIVFIQRYAADTWLIVESTVGNLIIVYIMGTILSTAFFLRERHLTKGQEVEFKKDRIQFKKGNQASKEFTIKEIKNFKDTKLFYRFFGVVKFTFVFKSAKDFRRYQKPLLLKPDEIEPVLKNIDAMVRKYKDMSPKRVTKDQ